MVQQVRAISFLQHLHLIFREVRDDLDVCAVVIDDELAPERHRRARRLVLVDGHVLHDFPLLSLERVVSQFCDVAYGDVRRHLHFRTFWHGRRDGCHSHPTTAY